MTSHAGTSAGTVVVTGGAGFIGSELVRQLVERGRRVTLIDNFINGKAENIAGLPGDLVTVVREDVRRIDRITSLLRDAAIVYHLACLGVRHSLHSPIENHEVNATATLHLLAACREVGVPRFVYVSSSEVYGTALRVPMDEEHPTFPNTVYGGSKLAGEGYTRAYCRSYGYPTVVVRPFNTYGPRSHHEGDSGEVIPKFLLRSMAGLPLVIFGDGTQTRDFTYVSDSARGIMLAGMTDGAVGRTINLGSGRETTIADLARLIAEVAGRPETRIEHIESRPGDVLRLYANAAQARALIGFHVDVALDDGLRRLRAWYDAQGVSPEQLLGAETVRNWER